MKRASPFFLVFSTSPVQTFPALIWSQARFQKCFGNFPLESLLGLEPISSSFVNPVAFSNAGLT